VSTAAQPDFPRNQPVGRACPRVVISVATFRRPTMLRGLLQSLAALEFRKSAPEVLLVVVDNDAEASARLTVESLRPSLGFPLQYAVEPERNISLARNHGVRLALEAGADFVAFVDDDETVTPTWLDELVAGQARYGADVIGGPVEPAFDPRAPDWIIRTRFFHHPRYPTGTRLRVAGTGNALVAAALLRGDGLPFDPAFGVSGGGDSEFFMRRHRLGAEIAWVDEALVTERVPMSRARAGWMLRRAFRYGNGAMLCERAMTPPLRRRAARLGAAAARLGFGAVVLVPSLVLGRRGAMAALSQVAYGVGCFAALVGYRYVEYDTVHGE
jgi:succinoglycan biosynthesis protein ExoM